MTLPVLKELKCPNCGHALAQRLATAQTLVCPACNTYVAIGTEEAEALGKGTQIPKPPVPIPLGAMTTLRGVKYFVLGRVLYRGWDDEDRWHWTEWLMGGEDGKLLWLSYDEEDGFVMFEKMRIRAAFNPETDMTIPLGENQQAYITERYPAKILAAEGELTWQAKQGENLLMAEGTTGAKKISIQKTAEELEVYQGTKLNERDVAAAFGDQKWMQQIDSRKKTGSALGTLGCVGIVLGVCSLLLAAYAYYSGSKMVTQTVSLNNEQRVVTFPVTFDKAGRPAMIKVDLQGALPSNSNAEVEINVVAPDGDDVLTFENEFWSESGFDDEGSWSEKDYTGRGRFVPPQAGVYNIQVEMGESNVSGMQVVVEVYKNHMLYTWFILYGVIVVGFGLLTMFMGFGESAKKPGV